MKEFSILHIFKPEGRIRLSTAESYTVLFLGIPFLVWFATWTKVYFVLAFVLLLLFLLTPLRFSFRIRLNSEIISFWVISIVLLVLLGYGELLPASGDWAKHNAILMELYKTGGQPVHFHPESGGDFHLNYGLSFYIIPSFIAGLFKTATIIPLLILLQTSFGLLLISVWVKKCFKLPYISLLLILLIGRLDYLTDIPWFLKEDLSNTDRFLKLGINQFLGIIDQTPQHSIPAMLCFLISFNYFIRNEGQFATLVFILALSISWTPFIVFILLPFAILFPRRLISAIKTALQSRIFWLGLIITTIFLLYYSLHVKVGDIVFLGTSVKKIVYRIVMKDFFIHLLIPGLLILLNYRYKIFDEVVIQLMIVSTLLSMIYQFIGYGYFHDFAGKTVFVSIFYVNILFFTAFKIVKSKILIVLLGIVTFTHMIMPVKTTAMHMISSRSDYYKTAFQHNPFTFDKQQVPGLEEVLKEPSEFHQYAFLKQYLGENTTALKAVLKQPKILPQSSE